MRRFFCLLYSLHFLIVLRSLHFKCLDKNFTVFFISAGNPLWQPDVEKYNLANKGYLKYYRKTFGQVLMKTAKCKSTGLQALAFCSLRGSAS